MEYFTIGQKLAIGFISSAFIVNIPYFLEKLQRKSDEKIVKAHESAINNQDKLAEASRLTEEARCLLIKSNQIQEEFLLNDILITTPGPSSSKVASKHKKVDATNNENVKFEEESKRNVKKRSENLVNTLLVLGEDGEFIESIRFTEKDYVDALIRTQTKTNSNFMKNCFK